MSCKANFRQVDHVLLWVNLWITQVCRKHTSEIFTFFSKGTLNFRCRTQCWRLNWTTRRENWRLMCRMRDSWWGRMICIRWKRGAQCRDQALSISLSWDIRKLREQKAVTCRKASTVSTSQERKTTGKIIGRAPRPYWREYNSKKSQNWALLLSLTSTVARTVLTLSTLNRSWSKKAWLVNHLKADVQSSQLRLQ